MAILHLKVEVWVDDAGIGRWGGYTLTVLTRKARTINAITDELNRDLFTIKSWMREAVHTHQKPLPETKRPDDWSPQERLLA